MGGIALGAVLLLMAASVNAQTWSLPIRAGWSNASITGGNQLGSESVNGFVGSVGAALRLNPDVSVEFDIAYAQKGAKGIITNEVANSPSNPPQPGPIYTIDGETSLDYLEFWGMVIGHFEVADQWELKGYLGVSLGNLLNAEVEGTANGDPIKLDISDGIKSADFAGLVGGGIAYELKSVTVTMEFMAELSFVDINDSVLPTDFKNRAYYTMLGVAIPLPSDS
jgi:hypothetical protein